MKKVKLIHYTTEGKNYVVRLGNGNKVSFHRKRDAEKYLQEASRFITSRLHSLNVIYAEVFRYHRLYWFYLDHNKLTSYAYKYKTIDRNCNNRIIAIGNCITIMVQRCTFPNGNHFVFSHLRNICDFLKQIIDDLRMVAETKSITGDLHQLYALSRYIVTLEKEIFTLDANIPNDHYDSFEAIERNRNIKIV